MLRLIPVALTALMLTAFPAAAQKLSLNQISQYLNSIQSAKSPFTQINGDGSISTGTIYIKRPGKARFEYNPPEQALVLAWSGAVYIFDRKVGGQPETYPLSQTPLSIILDANVNLGQAGMVQGHRQDGNKTIVTAQDPRRPQYGSLELVFTDNPLTLRQWVVIDGQGQRTTTALSGLTRVGSLGSSLFSIPTEISRRGG